MGAFLAEAAASHADASTAAPAESSAKPAAPASDATGPAQPGHHYPHGVFDAFMASGAKLPMADLCRLVITMMVDSRVTDNYIEPNLIPRLQDHERL